MVLTEDLKQHEDFPLGSGPRLSTPGSLGATGTGERVLAVPLDDSGSSLHGHCQNCASNTGSLATLVMSSVLKGDSLNSHALCFQSQYKLYAIIYWKFCPQFSA